MGDLKVRFRHVCGDIGPFLFPSSANVQDLREKLCQEWPKDGTLGKDTPTNPSDLKIILSGRFLDSSECLEELKRAMGDPRSDAVVTMHVVVRSAASVKSTAGKLGKEEQGGCCSCSIQ